MYKVVYLGLKLVVRVMKSFGRFQLVFCSLDLVFLQVFRHLLPLHGRFWSEMSL